MKKALPLGLLLCFSVFSLSYSFANDGGHPSAPPTGGNHRPWEPVAAGPSTGAQSGGFWGDLWNDILSIFGHHDHHAAPPSAGSGTPGAGSGSPGGSAPSAPGAGGAGSPSVPVNGGLVLLLAAGLAFGILKASKYKLAPQN